MPLHLFQQTAARPDVEGEAVAVCPAIPDIVDPHLDWLGGQFLLPVGGVHLRHIHIRQGQGHLLSNGEIPVNDPCYGDDGLRAFLHGGERGVRPAL